MKKTLIALACTALTAVSLATPAVAATERIDPGRVTVTPNYDVNTTAPAGAALIAAGRDDATMISTDQGLVLPRATLGDRPADGTLADASYHVVNSISATGAGGSISLSG